MKDKLTIFRETEIHDKEELLICLRDLFVEYSCDDSISHTRISLLMDFIKAMAERGIKANPELPAETLRDQLDLVSEGVKVTFESTNETVLSAVNDSEVDETVEDDVTDEPEVTDPEDDVTDEPEVTDPEVTEPETGEDEVTEEPEVTDEEPENIEE